MNKKYDAVIFDLDGTLYNFKNLPIRLVFAYPVDMLKMRADQKVRRAMKGVDLGNPDEFYSDYASRMSLMTGNRPECILKWYLERYTKKQMVRVLRRNYRLRDSVEEVIIKLAALGVKVAVFSDYPNVAERLEALGMKPSVIRLLAGTYCAQQYGCLKPAVRPFLSIAKDFEVEPGHCLVVGDRDDTDGNGARSAGMDFVQIKTHKTRIIDLEHPVVHWREFAKEVMEK